MNVNRVSVMAVFALVPMFLSPVGAAPVKGKVTAAPASAKYVDVTTMSCDQADGWVALDFAKKDSTVTLSVVDVNEASGKRRAIELRSGRMAGSAPSAVAEIVLTDFATLSFDAWSEKDTLLMVAIQDCDKASFHAASPLPAKVWTHIRLVPTDFSINDDSTVKKDKLDSLKLRNGVVIGDLGGLLGKNNANTLRIDNLRIESRPMNVVKLPKTIDGKTIEVKANSMLQGDTTIVNGGSLRILAPRAIVDGNIAVGKGSLVTDHSVVTLKARMPHERAIVAQAGATIRFADTTFMSMFMSSLHLLTGSHFEATRTECAAGGFTAEVPTGCTVEMNAVRLFGEFIVGPGAKFSARDSGPILIWLMPSAAKQVDLRMPKEAAIAKWQSDAKDGFGIDLTNCVGVSWGLISLPGTHVKVTGSQLLASGIVFTGGTQTLTGLKNHEPATALKIDVSDRTLEFADCTVGAWNVYPFGSSDITLKDCVLGEAFTTGTAKLSMEDCTIDGTGGYMRAGDSSRMALTRCRTTCAMVADGQGSITFQDCDLHGPLTATGTATVTLANTRLTGAITKLGKAQVTIR